MFDRQCQHLSHGQVRRRHPAPGRAVAATGCLPGVRNQPLGAGGAGAFGAAAAAAARGAPATRRPRGCTAQGPSCMQHMTHKPPAARPACGRTHSCSDLQLTHPVLSNWSVICRAFVTPPDAFVCCRRAWRRPFRGTLPPRLRRCHTWSPPPGCTSQRWQLTPGMHCTFDSEVLIASVAGSNSGTVMLN